MRVLMTCIPGHGHFLPMAPLAHALLGHGHEVRVATGASFGAVVEQAGLVPVAAGIDWLESAPERRFPEVAGLSARLRSVALGQVIAYIHPRAMAQDLRSVMADWRPDVVVVEPSEWGGVMAAQLEDVPHALLAIALCSGTTAVGGALFPALDPDDAEEQRARADLFGAGRGLQALREELGLQRSPPPWVAPPLNKRYLTLDTAPPSLHFFVPEAASRTAHPLRPVPFSLAGSTGEAPSIPSRRGPAGDRPTIHVTLGTVMPEASTLRLIVEALADQHADVVVAAGPALPPDQLGLLPAHVRVEPWVDYDVLLPRCDLVVTHGGSGTVLAALAHGVPLLVVPQGADQPVNAARVRSVGAGRFIPRGQLTPTAVRREVRTLLGDPVYRLNARRLQTEIAAMPGPEEAVKLLERLAVERRPLEVRTDLVPTFRAAEVPVLPDPRAPIP